MKSSMKKKGCIKPLLLTILLCPSMASASGWFIGYEFGEMAFNNFQNIAGEIGYKFKNKHSVRLSYLNIALSERHLSSGEARAVDGDNVEGLWRAVDIYYDIPITNNLYFSPIVGYHDNKYSHTVLPESVRNKTTLAGAAVAYVGDDILGIDSLYYRFSLTLTHSFNALERTNLGDSVVNGGSLGFIPQIFVGYKF